MRASVEAGCSWSSTACLAEALVRAGPARRRRATLQLEARASLPEEDPYASAAALVAEIITDGGAAPVATRSEPLRRSGCCRNSTCCSTSRKPGWTSPVPSGVPVT